MPPWLVRRAQDVAVANAGQAAGAGDEQEAQGAHAADQVRIAAFPRPRFRFGEGVERDPKEIVGNDAELLPLTL